MDLLTLHRLGKQAAGADDLARFQGNAQPTKRQTVFLFRQRSVVREHPHGLALGLEPSHPGSSRGKRFPGLVQDTVGIQEEAVERLGQLAQPHLGWSSHFRRVAKPQGIIAIDAILR